MKHVLYTVNVLITKHSTADFCWSRSISVKDLSWTTWNFPMEKMLYWKISSSYGFSLWNILFSMNLWYLSHSYGED